MIFFTILVGIALLIAANALYVAAEFGAVSVSRARLRALAEDGHVPARRLLPVVEQPALLDRYIAACQIGITGSSLLLGAYGEGQIAAPLASALEGLGSWDWAAAHSAASAIVLVGLGLLQMVLGELLPKAIALRHPDRAALATAPAVEASVRLLAPLIWVFNGSGLLLLRLLGIRPMTHRHVHSPGEIDLLLSEADAAGELDAKKRRRLRRALRLSRRRARDLMVPREHIVAISLDTPFEQVIRFVSEQPYLRFPAYHQTLDDVAGLLHTKDLVKAYMRGERPQLSELLRPRVVVPLGATADQVLVSLREHRASHAIVVDNRQRVVGLVTLGDVLTDVFGTLGDEFKGRRRARPGLRR